LTDRSVEDIVAGLAAAATTLNDGGAPVHLLLTLAVPTDEVLYGVFEAQSPEIVSQLCAPSPPPGRTRIAGIGRSITPLSE